MINIPIDEIKKTDIDDLVINKTTETKTLEYKEDLPSSTDGHIKEFLADVSLLANAAGAEEDQENKPDRLVKKNETKGE